MNDLYIELQDIIGSPGKLPEGLLDRVIAAVRKHPDPNDGEPVEGRTPDEPAPDGAGKDESSDENGVVRYKGSLHCIPLAPCPMCGTEPNFVGYEDESAWAAECPTCGLYLGNPCGYGSRLDLCNDWNRCATPPAAAGDRNSYESPKTVTSGPDVTETIIQPQQAVSWPALKMDVRHMSPVGRNPHATLPPCDHDECGPLECKAQQAGETPRTEAIFDNLLARLQWLYQGKIKQGDFLQWVMIARDGAEEIERELATKDARIAALERESARFKGVAARALRLLFDPRYQHDEQPVLRELFKARGATSPGLESVEAEIREFIKEEVR